MCSKCYGSVSWFNQSAIDDYYYVHRVLGGCGGFYSPPPFLSPPHLIWSTHAGVCTKRAAYSPHVGKCTHMYLCGGLGGDGDACGGAGLYGGAGSWMLIISPPAVSMLQIKVDVKRSIRITSHSQTVKLWMRAAPSRGGEPVYQIILWTCRQEEMQRGPPHNKHPCRLR